MNDANSWWPIVLPSMDGSTMLLWARSDHPPPGLAGSERAFGSEWIAADLEPLLGEEP